ncbi:MAG: U32 family peptidase [Ignavibacteria bacterium]|nr:U32 family peptidase [Ignavibacteria bacterium]
MLRKKPELAAPAGNWTMLRTVIQNGADAIYFGLEDFNMRAQAENFTVEDLPEIVAYCSEHGVKTHLVVNVIIYEHELQRIEIVLLRAAEAGVNLIVCWDLAVIALCKKIGLSFCISTQASISNSLAAEQYKQMGASRIVTARECTLSQIKQIRKNTDIEIEAFVHGAMCVAVSGRCFMSHEMFGRSANRGDCLQSCRREYEIYDRRADVSLLIGKDYVMSAKDLNTLSFVEQLIEAGIDAFKIEGRKRSPEYAAKVTSVYRRAIDAYFAGHFSEEFRSMLQTDLEHVYNRGFSTGFYFNRPGSKEFTEHEGNISPVRKEFIGVVLNYFDKKQIAHIRLSAGGISIGEKILIMGKTTGVVEVEPAELMVNDVDGKNASEKGDLITFPCLTKVRQGDKVYKIVDREDFQEYA